MLPNEHTFEFGQARLKTKECLTFTMRQSGSQVWYLIEDEISGKFFQVGLPQYVFLSMLDGQRTVNFAVMKSATLLRQHAFDDREAANICKWAIESGLVETELSSSSNRRALAAEKELKRKSISWLNPVTLKIPLFQPDRATELLTRYLGWLVSPVGWLLWCVVVCYGFTQLVLNWDAFVDQRLSVISSSDLLWFGVGWIGLKLIHETAHAVFCKKFGGRVPSCGMLLLLLIPLPYVDVTSSWRFENKWHRIGTSAAGMMVEIFVAAICCCIWVQVEPGALKYHTGTLIIAATAHTLFFNANPLMRFDGYYMLADWLEIPNLSTSGRKYVKSVFKRIYFGTKATPLSDIGFRALVIKLYGFMAIGWFFLISVSLMIGASCLLEGVGLLIAIVGIGLWFGVPVMSLIMFLLGKDKLQKPNRLRFACASILTIGLVATVLCGAPAPSVIRAPVVVDFHPLHVVRVQSEGFVQQLHVKDGDMVEPGQLLVTLQNHQLSGRMESLLIDIKISKRRIDGLLSVGDIAAWKLEKASLDALLERQIELEMQLKQLEIRSPDHGTVLALELYSTIGTWMLPGDELLSIGDPESVEAIALMRQQDVKWMSDNTDVAVDFQFWGQSESVDTGGSISRIDPRLSEQLPHEAFAANYGGPLPVMQQEESASQESQGMRLVHPRAMMRIQFKKDMDLMAGQMGEMFIRNRNENLGQYLWASVTRFVRAANTRTHGL